MMVLSYVRALTYDVCISYTHELWEHARGCTVVSCPQLDSVNLHVQLNLTNVLSNDAHTHTLSLSLTHTHTGLK